MLIHTANAADGFQANFEQPPYSICLQGTIVRGSGGGKTPDCWLRQGQRVKKIKRGWEQRDFTIYSQCYYCSEICWRRS